MKIETQIETPQFNGNTIATGTATLTTPAQRVFPADPPGLLLNISPTWNASQAGRDGLNYIVRHEMGHILGLAHEMNRPDFVGSGVADCKKDSVTGGNFFFTASDTSSLMASGGTYCNSNLNLSSLDVIGVRNAYGFRTDDVVMTALGSTFARKVGTGPSAGIYEKRPTFWLQVGGQHNEYATVGNRLYGLMHDGSGIHRYTGTFNDPGTWESIGGPAGRILRCGTLLCAIDQTAQMGLWRYAGTSWTQIGTAKALQYASTLAKVYRLRDDMSQVEVYSGSGTTWNAVNTVAQSAIYATETDLYAMSLDGQTLTRYDSVTGNWPTVGGAGAHFVGVGSKLYGLTPNHDAVYEYPGSGTAWTKVGGPAHWIYGGDNSDYLHALNPAGNEIFRFYTGSGLWTSVGMP